MHRYTASALGYKAITLIHKGIGTLIYRGQRDTGGPVIIKTLTYAAASPGELAKLEREAEIARHVESSRVVRCYGMEQFDGMPAAVFEDIGGVSLEDLLTERQFGLQECLAIALAIVEGLEDIHRAGLMHNAVIPANIVLDPVSSRLNIIDFGATAAPTWMGPEAALGRISTAHAAYLAPERTGRMNRPVDYRSDFYSFGVTLYRLLTGKLPFDMTDLMELIHAHLAKTPPSPRRANPDIPLPLADIVLKLLAKSADERYQSAASLKGDLKTCLDRLVEEGTIPSFEIGRKDFAHSLILPQRLYGRARATTALISAYREAARGACRLVLVSGAGGTGKTVLAEELSRHVARGGGYFIRGKFDQYRGDTPYHAFVQAFREFSEIILAAEPKTLARWKKRLREAVGGNARLLTELIPELALVLENREEPPQLDGEEARNRFVYVLRNFVTAICSREHPVALFIDDLHWADEGSLALFKALLTNEETGHLLVVVCYRPEELSDGHPLARIIGQLGAQAVPATEIELGNLRRHDVVRLVADTLRATASYVRPLADSIYDKSGGNPFFARQILLFLYREKLLELDEKAGVWHWRLTDLGQPTGGSNVIDFLVDKLARLPDDTRQVVRVAACLGNRANLADLALACARPAEQLRRDLAPVEAEGLVALADAEVGFAHDRVQQAAISGLSDNERKKLHLMIGTRLLAGLPPERRDQALFGVANQLNAAVDLIQTPERRRELREINMTVADRARRSAAYHAAASYARVAAALAPADYWREDQEGAYRLFSGLAQAEYLAGRHEQAKELIDDLLPRARTAAQKVRGFTLLKDLVANYGKQFTAAVRAGLDTAGALGLEFPATPEAMRRTAQLGIDHITRDIAGKSLDELLILPAMADPGKRLVMRFLTDLWEAAYYHGDAALMQVCVTWMVETSLAHGNTSESAFGYVMYGALLAAAGDYDQAFRFGALALELNRSFGDPVLLPKVNNLFGNYINPYRRPFRSNVPLYEASVRHGKDNGDFLFGVWAAFFLVWSHFMSGHKLPFVYSKSLQHLPFVRQTNDRKMIHAYRLLQYVLLNLQGKTSSGDILRDPNLNVEDTLSDWEQDKFLPGAAWFAILACNLYYLYEDYRAGYEIARRHARNPTPELVMFPISQHYFYWCLCMIALYPAADGPTRQRFARELAKGKGVVDTWAASCPENFLAQQLILEAELTRIGECGRSGDPAPLYDQAVKAAKRGKLLQLQALANELAAKHHLARDQLQAARQYMAHAIREYRRWGAVRKAELLTENFPQLIARDAPPVPTTQVAMEPPPASEEGEMSLDLEAAIKSAQAISEEIDLGSLLSKMIRIIVEDAGAQNGFLVTDNHGEFFIAAQATDEGEQVRVLQHRPLDECSHVSAAMVRYVARTGNSLVLRDASQDGHFGNDPHVLRAGVKSVLCAPLRHQGKLNAVLYLENNLSPGTFTDTRLKVLNILLSQAAISLANARLYRELQKEIGDRRQAEAELAEHRDHLEDLVTARTVELEASNQELEAFSYSVSHDLRAPLRGIEGFSAILLEEYAGKLDDAGRGYLGRIRAGVQRMGVLIDALLELSRITRSDMYPETMDLADLVLESFCRLRDQEPERDVELVLGEGLAGYGDRRLLRAVIENLVGNAWKFTAKRAHARIAFSAAVETGEKVFCLRDNGAGFDMAYADKLFGAFQRLHRMDEFEGTGIGLATVARVVHRHGGRIWAEGKVDEGAAFYFTLPCPQPGE